MQELRDLPQRYARAVDRREADVLVSLFTPDGFVTGPGFDYRGSAALRDMVRGLDKFCVKSMHMVMNQTLEMTDEHEATGEVYCLANHIIAAEDGRWTNNAWAIRYQDRFQRIDGVWLFKSRTLVVDWTSNTPVRAMTEV